MMAHRWKIVLSAGLLCAIVAVGYWWQRPQDSAGHRGQERDAVRKTGLTEPTGDASGRPPGESGSSSSLRVVAPGLESGRIPIAIAGPDRIRTVQRIPANTEIPLDEWVPSGDRLVLAAIDDLSRSDVLDTLRERFVWASPVVVEPGDRPELVEVRFDEGPRTRRIRITTRTETEKPVSDVSFWLSRAHPATDADLPLAFPVTDGEGQAVSPWLPGGRYRVRVREAPTGLRPAVETEEYLVDLREEREASVEIVFTSAGKVTGVVRADPGRKYGVTIIEQPYGPDAFLKPVHTKEDGTFEVSSLPPGDYFARSWPDGYMQVTESFSVLPGRSTHVVLTPKTGGAVVVGRVLDQNGKPFDSGININAPLRAGQPPSGKGTGVDDEGRFREVGVGPGPWLAIIWDYGYAREFTVDPNQERVDLGTFRKPEHEGSGVVHGVIKDDHGEALRGTLACLKRVGDTSGWFRFMQTDGGGEYRFESVEPGRYLVWNEPAVYNNYVAQEPPVEVTVAADSERRVDLELDRVTR